MSRIDRDVRRCFTDEEWDRLLEQVKAIALLNCCSLQKVQVHVGRVDPQSINCVVVHSKTAQRRNGHMCTAFHLRELASDCFYVDENGNKRALVGSPFELAPGPVRVLLDMVRQMGSTLDQLRLPCTLEWSRRDKDSVGDPGSTTPSDNVSISGTETPNTRSTHKLRKTASNTYDDDPHHVTTLKGSISVAEFKALLRPLIDENEIEEYEGTGHPCFIARDAEGLKTAYRQSMAQGFKELLENVHDTRDDDDGPLPPTTACMIRSFFFLACIRSCIDLEGYRVLFDNMSPTPWRYHFQSGSVGLQIGDSTRFIPVFPSVSCVLASPPQDSRLIQLFWVSGLYGLFVVKGFLREIAAGVFTDEELHVLWNFCRPDGEWSQATWPLPVPYVTELLQCALEMESTVFFTRLSGCEFFNKVVLFGDPLCGNMLGYNYAKSKDIVIGIDDACSKGVLNSVLSRYSDAELLKELKSRDMLPKSKTMQWIFESRPSLLPNLSLTDLLRKGTFTEDGIKRESMCSVVRCLKNFTFNGTRRSVRSLSAEALSALFTFKCGLQTAPERIQSCPPVFFLWYLPLFIS